jgi:acetolactate synthase-1/3 small subunit
MNKEQLFTVSVFTENRIGLLGRITIILTRRRFNIESISVSESEIQGVHRYTLVIKTTREQAEKVTGQIRKLVDVLRAFVHGKEEIVSRELALYKLSNTLAGGEHLQRLLAVHKATVHATDPEFVVIGKTGSHAETEALRQELEKTGLLEFSRSGQVSITRPMKMLRTSLEETE